MVKELSEASLHVLPISPSSQQPKVYVPLLSGIAIVTQHYRQSFCVFSSLTYIIITSWISTDTVWLAS